MLRHLAFLVFALSLLGSHLVAQSGASDSPFVKVIKSKTKSLEKTFLDLATKRTEALANSKHVADKKWAAEWSKTEDQRSEIHQAYTSLAQDFTKLSGIKDHDRLMLFAQLLRAWIAHGEVVTIRETLQSKFKKPGQLLLLLAATERRKLLHQVSTRAQATPGVTDLDVLLEVVNWEVLFLTSKPNTPIRHDDLSTDLILLFTDRGAGGIVKSNAGFYRPGLLLDRGFKAELRDESNQVRHFCWALRMFAKSENPDSTESILRLKEWRDAKVRKTPINEADLKLNRAARRIASILKLQVDPLALRDVPKLLKTTLGTIAVKEN
ncbi:MAG: hypothetical protein ACI97A_003134 [Planctomycetota bacterium]|jgi:hypothetical protein